MARGRKRVDRSSEARETRLISLAIDQAERQLEEGTAPPSVLAYYLKLGSSREKLERDKLEAENKLLRAKAVAVEKSANMEELYAKVVDAIRSYSPTPDQDDDEEEIY